MDIYYDITITIYMLYGFFLRVVSHVITIFQIPSDFLIMFDFIITIF